MAAASATPVRDRLPLERLGDSSPFGETVCELLGRAVARDVDCARAGLKQACAVGDGSSLLLRMLELSGWDVVVTTAFAGQQLELLDDDQTGPRAVLVSVSRGALEFRAVGASVAELVPDLFVEAVRSQRLSVAA